MKPLLASLAAVLLLSGPVLAQDEHAKAKAAIDSARAAAKTQQAVVQNPVGGLVYDGRKYNFARPSYNGGGGVGAIHDAREYLFKSDSAQVGGPRHVADFIFEPCMQNPGVCLVLLEPIRDILRAGGDDVNPYVYSVALKVLYSAAHSFKRIDALNGAYDKYTANNQGAARGAALEIIRTMLASPRAIKADDATDYHHSVIYTKDTSVAAMGATIAQEFEDGKLVESDLKSSLEKGKSEGQILAAAAALTDRAPNPDTMARLGIAFQKKDPALSVAGRETLLKDMSRVAFAVWPRQGADPKGHGIWPKAAIEATFPYFTLACAVKNDDKNQCAVTAKRSPLCDTATALSASLPRKHRANCIHPDGFPGED
jgi:hypothetical protein